MTPVDSLLGILPAKKAGAYTPPTHGSLDSSVAGSLHAASPGIWSDEQIAAWREVRTKYIPFRKATVLTWAS